MLATDTLPPVAVRLHPAPLLTLMRYRLLTIKNTRLYPHYESADEVNACTVRFLTGD